VNKFNKLGLQLVAVATVATLCGPSAFAEDRHRNGTRSGEARATRQEGSSGRVERTQPAQQVQPQESRGTVTTERSQYRGGNDSRNSQRADTYNRSNRGNDSNNRGTRNDSYNRSNRNNGSYNRDNRNSGSYNRDNRSNGSYNRGGSYNRNDSYRGGSRGTPSYYHGRVSRYDRYNGGYRVWIVGAPYPFFIPEARFRLFPHFGVGIDLRLGGYYNSAGYYDYYDDQAAYNTSGGLRGVVETVDYRRGTFVLRDEASGRFVTAVMSGGDRRWDDLRSGDYVEVSGDWNRSGVFQAYSLDSIGDYRR
jgi:hypothetical protein